MVCGGQWQWAVAVVVLRVECCLVGSSKSGTVCVPQGGVVGRVRWCVWGGQWED